MNTATFGTNMAHILHARNVNGAFREALWWIRAAGTEEQSRNGPVLVAPGPVITEYSRPWERVLFSPRRDANPVFHLMESLWMLTGESKLEFLLPFNARMAAYGENGIQWGAYGKRWRGFFGHDQIKLVIKELKDNPTSRRAVIGMWDSMLDLKHRGPDIPCNTHIYFDLRPRVKGGAPALNMTVCCRSNDLLWGAYGANAVHFSILQEVIAHELRAEIGVYRQMSNNFHIYTELPMAKEFIDQPPHDKHDLYEDGKANSTPILVGRETLDDLTADCRTLVYADGGTMSTQFMREVADPLHDAYLDRKAGAEYTCPAGKSDWFVAFRDWVARREQVRVD